MDNKWRYEPSINYKRSSASAVSVNNTIFVTGGLFINDSNSMIVINNMENLTFIKTNNGRLHVRNAIWPEVYQLPNNMVN
ncbi:unknown [Taterapox virus]|uniref:Kelch-like protein n=1 Tax=Taterapox virus TaxID=28871 RepID=Q0NP14_9POXV|nr:hypothetical protein TATV_DAH68_197 [Taterapox virus]ABD97763.1 unknown [Taterapox virus]